jgi:hypothetical protein
MKQISLSFLLTLVLAGCSSGSHDLVVVSKEIHREQLGQSVAGDQFGSAAGSVVENTVIGQLRNDGTEEARDVVLTFHVNGGGQNYTLAAHIPSVPAGKTVSFQTRGMNTPYTLQFRNENAVEIAVGKKE